MFRLKAKCLISDYKVCSSSVAPSMPAITSHVIVGDTLMEAIQNFSLAFRKTK